MSRSTVGRVSAIILGVLLIIGGLYCLFTPTLTYMAIGFVVGICMVIYSIGGIMIWNELRKLGRSDGWGLASAIISLALGVILLVSDAMQLVVDMAIIYLIALWLIAIGIVRIVWACRTHQARKAFNFVFIGRNWVASLVIGILLVAVGILSFVNPSGLIVALGWMIGLSVIVAGVDMIIVAA